MLLVKRRRLLQNIEHNFCNCFRAQTSFLMESSRMNTTDSLVKGAIAGDEASFSGLYERFAKRLEGFVSKKLRGPVASLVEPEDIVQEVFAEVFTRIGRFQPRGKGTFYGLLMAVARRRMIDLRRRFAVRPEGRRESLGVDSESD